MDLQSHGRRGCFRAVKIKFRLFKKKDSTHKLIYLTEKDQDEKRIKLIKAVICENKVVCRA